MTLPAVDTADLTDFLARLLNTPSPTGRAEPAIALVEQELAGIGGLSLRRTRKGALVAEWAVDGGLPPVALTAHVDTLGAMVKDLKSNGRLAITRIGGLQLNAVETEGCWVYTSKGEKIRGSLLIDTASGHVYGPKAAETKRDERGSRARGDRHAPEPTRGDRVADRRLGGRCSRSARASRRMSSRQIRAQ